MARRKTVRPRKKARSAAQRAATKRMLAANRARRGGRTTTPKRPRRTRARAASASAPARRRSPSRKRSVARSAPRRASRRRSSGMRLGGSGGLVNQSIALIKDGAVMGAGALGVDMVMGQVNKVLPAGWDTPLDADGTPNFKNAAVKAAVSVGIGYFGARYLPASMRGLALKAATGALSIQAYNLIKGSIPSEFLPLGGQQRLSGAPRNTLMIPAGAPGNSGSLGMAPLTSVRTYTR